MDLIKAFTNEQLKKELPEVNVGPAAACRRSGPRRDGSIGRCSPSFSTSIDTSVRFW